MSGLDDTQNVIGWGTRGWLDIINAILEVCEDGALKTHVIYRCGLNSKQGTQYMKFLQDNNMLENVRMSSSSKRRIFKTTTLGKKYMAAYKQLESIFKVQSRK